MTHKAGVLPRSNKQERAAIKKQHSGEPCFRMDLMSFTRTFAEVQQFQSGIRIPILPSDGTLMLCCHMTSHA